MESSFPLVGNIFTITEIFLAFLKRFLKINYNFILISAVISGSSYIPDSNPNMLTWILCLNIYGFYITIMHLNSFTYHIYIIIKQDYYIIQCNRISSFATNLERQTRKTIESQLVNVALSRCNISLPSSSRDDWGESAAIFEHHLDQCHRGVRTANSVGEGCQTAMVHHVGVRAILQHKLTAVDCTSACGNVQRVDVSTVFKLRKQSEN